MKTPRKRIVGAVLILIAMACCSAFAQESARPPMPDPGDGYRTLNLGNSLVGQLHAQVEYEGRRVHGVSLLPFLAHEFGYPGHEGKIVGAAGVPLQWLWSQPAKKQEFVQALEAQEWDLLTAMPFGFQNRRGVVEEAAGGAGFYYQMLEKYPGTPFLIYQTWGSGRSPGGAHYDLGEALSEGGGDAQLYVEGLNLAIDEYMNPVAHILRQEFPNQPVYIVPVPQVLVEFQERLEASPTGEYAGVDHIAQLLDEGGRSVHLSRKGLYLNAMTHLAAYYRRNPAEADVPYDYGNTFAFDLAAGFQTAGLTQEDAREMAQLAWDVVSSYPATPVTREPFAFDDMEKPTAPQDVQVEVLGPKHARVSWAAATDNEGIQTYGVYANHGFAGTIGPDQTLEQVVTGLHAGRENLITVRAFDPTYNLTDAHVRVTPPTIRGDLLLGWNLSKYTDREEIRQGELPDENLVADTIAGGVQEGAVIKRGGGLENDTGVFGSCVDVSGIEAQPLAEAVQDDDYMTVTVAPVQGRELSLSAITFPLKLNEGGALAVLSSATGFEAGKAIDRIDNLPNGYLDTVALDLSGEPALQGLSEPVELRIYFYDAGREILLGRPNSGTPDDVMDLAIHGSVN